MNRTVCVCVVCLAQTICGLSEDVVLDYAGLEKGLFTVYSISSSKITEFERQKRQKHSFPAFSQLYENVLKVVNNAQFTSYYSDKNSGRQVSPFEASADWHFFSAEVQQLNKGPWYDRTKIDLSNLFVITFMFQSKNMNEYAKIVILETGTVIAKTDRRPTNEEVEFFSTKKGFGTEQ